MQRRLRQVRGSTAFLALTATLILGVVPAFGGVTLPSQPSATERLVRQEDARAVDFARYQAIATRNETLDARERGMTTRPSPAPLVVLRSGSDEFAWGTAALGLGAGVAAMCVLLGCVWLVRGQGRLRSA